MRPTTQTSDPSTGSTVTAHGGPIRAMAVLDDGRTLVSGGLDSAIIVWDLATNTARRVLRFHDSAVEALVALKGGCFVSGGEDGRIARWCGDGPTPERLIGRHAGQVTSLAVSPDGTKLASGSSDWTIRLWNLEALPSESSGPRESSGPGGKQDADSQAFRSIEGFEGHVAPVAFLADGSGLISGDAKGLVWLTSLEPARTPQKTKARGPDQAFFVRMNAVLALPSGQFLVASSDGSVALRDPRLETLATLDLGNGPLTTLALSADGRTIAVAGLRTPVTLVDFEPPSMLRIRSQILGPGLPVWALAFTGGDKPELITGGADRAIRRWDAVTGAPSGGQVAAAQPDDATRDAHPGARVFRACRACHGLTPADTNRAGPTLHGLFGRRIATAPGYAYSDALRGMDIVWTPQTVSQLFEVGPNAYTPGTKMPEQKLGDPDDRKALVEWLAQVTAP